MSAHLLPNAGTIESLRGRIRTGPAFQAAYPDGQYRAKDFLMGIQGGEFTREDAGRDLFDARTARHHEQ